MRFIIGTAGFAVMTVAVILLGIGGINQLVGGIEASPNDVGDIVWGIIRAWLTIPVFWVGAVCTAVAVFND